MLITCPECKREISDQSEQCIHCGYPLKKMNTCNVNGTVYDFSDILLDINDSQKTPASCIRKISDKCNIPIYEAKEIYFKIKNENTLPQNIKCENKEQLSIPKCPTCNSTNIKKISSSSKVVNTAMWGFLGTKRHKTFHCNNCSYEW